MIDDLTSSYIHAASSDNFVALVLENSDKGPVLVNFWSRKAGPSLRQYPALDKLIHQYAGRLLLVNVDTETEFVFTREYAVTSVPMLKLFRQRQVVATWRGYQSEEELSRVLDRYVARESDQVLATAIRQYAEGNPGGAYDSLTKAILDDPKNPRLPAAMCKLLKHERRFVEALKLVSALPEELRTHPELQQLQWLLEFCVEIDPQRELATLEAQLASMPTDLELRRQLVARYAEHQAYDAALQQLVAMMELDQAFEDNYPQRAMLRVFNLLGSGHPLVMQYRTHLNRYRH